MKTKILFMSFLLSTAFSGAAFAQDIRLDLRAGAQITTHESIDAVADANTIGSRSLRLSSALFDSGLRAVIEYGAESTRTVARHVAIDLFFVRHRFTAGADWGPTFFGMLRPMVGVTAGYALGNLDVDTASTRYKDFSHDIIGDVYLGTDMTVPFGRRDTTKWFGNFGLRFGARGQTGAQFDELRSPDQPDDDPWNRVAPDLGTLHPNGWYWDLGIGVSRRF